MSKEEKDIEAPQTLSDEQIDVVAVPYVGLGGVENYRAFARDIAAALKAPAAPTDAIARIQAYIKRREQSKQTHQESIHAFDLGPDTGVELLLSDIKALVNAPAAPSEPMSAENIEAIWNALPGIEIFNQASKQGIKTEHAMRVAFAHAIQAAAPAAVGYSQVAQNSSEVDLPPLPETNYNGYSDGSEPLYTQQMMHDYASAAVAVEREECAKMSTDYGVQSMTPSGIRSLINKPVSK